MWNYEKFLIYPARVQSPCPKAAHLLSSLLGGSSGEISSAIHCMCLRHCMPLDEGKALLTDIATEELAHVELLSALIHQLKCSNCACDLNDTDLELDYIAHAGSLSTAEIPCTCNCGDPIADLHQLMARKQTMRSRYDNLIRVMKDPGVLDALRFLRQRELVHYQRIGELLWLTQANLDPQNPYICNPAFDACAYCAPLETE